MKKNYLFLLSLLALSACSNTNKNVSNLEMYTDTPSVQTGNLVFEYSQTITYAFSGNWNISTYLSVTNVGQGNIDFKLDDSSKFIREQDNAAYQAGGLTFKEFTLEPNIKTSLSFQATVPSSCEEERYRLMFSFNEKTFVMHLYDKPDEIREIYKINFVVDGERVGFNNGLQYKKLYQYSWVSSDYLWSCKKWYFDENYENEVPVDYVLTNQVTVYGKKSQILEFVDFLPGQCIVNAIGYIPFTNEIVLPGQYNGSTVVHVKFDLVDNTLSSKMETLYIPNTMLSLPTVYYTAAPNLKYVHYQGSETQWNEMTGGSNPFSSTVQLFFQSYK